MLYAKCAKLFDGRTPRRGLRCLVLLMVAASFFLVTNGCKSSGKSHSWNPFYGGSPSATDPATGLSTDPAMQPLPPLSSEAGAPIVVSESFGPAVPTQSGLSSGTISGSSYGTSSGYAPPDLAASSGTASSGTAASHSTSSPTSYSGGTTMVYNAAPNTETNAGGVAGSLPSAYSASSGTTSSGYTYGTSPSYATDSGQTSGSSYDNSSGYRSGSSNNGTSRYGSDSPSGTDYYHGPSTGHSTSLSPERQVLEDGDYMAANGTKYRVINGKQYELVQYSEIRTPNLPSGTDTGGMPSYQPPVYETSTAVPMTSGYRTATQMTEAFGRVQGQVPVPTYDAILGQQNGLAQNVTQGIITIGEPVNITIIPAADSMTEAVASIDHAEYSEIGAMTSPTSLTNGESNGTEREMQDSFWSIMAGQDNNYLLYGTNLQQELKAQNQPTFYPLIDPLGIDSYQRNLNAAAIPANLPRTSNPSTPFYVPGNLSVFPNRSCFGY